MVSDIRVSLDGDDGVVLVGIVVGFVVIFAIIMIVYSVASSVKKKTTPISYAHGKIIEKTQRSNQFDSITILLDDGLRIKLDCNKAVKFSAIVGDIGTVEYQENNMIGFKQDLI